MKTSTPKCPSSKSSLPTSPSPNHHQRPPEPTNHLIQHDLHGDDVEITLKKSGFLRTISSKLLRDFTELMYNLVYFSQHNNSPRHNEEDEDDEYSEYLMEDYSTFYTDYDQMATFAAPLNRQPSVPLKKTISLNETKSTSVPSFQSIELSKRDSNVQTDDSSFMKLSSKSSRSSKSSKEDSHLDVSQTSSDDASFFYRLKESAPKKGIVKETRVRKVFAPDNHKRHDQISYHHRDYSGENHLSESMRSSRSSNRELVPKQREIRPSPWKELLDPDHANSLLKLIFNMLIV